MAYSSVSATIGQSLPEGTAMRVGQPNLYGVLTNPDEVAVAAAVATLVADGATPTQAHVTALNTAWGTLLTNAVAKGDAVMLVDPTKVTTLTILSRVFAAFLQAARGGLGGLTA